MTVLGIHAALQELSYMVSEVGFDSRLWDKGVYILCVVAAYLGYSLPDFLQTVS